MFIRTKLSKFYFLALLFCFFNSIGIAEEEEVYLKAISDQIQVITKDLKTLEKAVYEKSDIVSSTNSRTNSPGRRGSAFSSTVHFQTVDDTFSSSFYNQQ